MSEPNEVAAATDLEPKWWCHYCDTYYAEYTNGCPRCHFGEPGTSTSLIHVDAKVFARIRSLQAELTEAKRIADLEHVRFGKTEELEKQLQSEREAREKAEAACAAVIINNEEKVAGCCGDKVDKQFCESYGCGTLLKINTRLRGGGSALLAELASLRKVCEAATLHRCPLCDKGRTTKIVDGTMYVGETVPCSHCADLCSALAAHEAATKERT